MVCQSVSSHEPRRVATLICLGAVALVASVVGCGSSETSGPPGNAGNAGNAGDAGDGGDPGSAATGGGGRPSVPPVDLGTPLLERAPRLEHECAELRPIAKLGIPWGGGEAAAAPDPSSFFLVRSTAASPAFQFGDDIVLSTLSADGTLGPAWTVRSHDAFRVFGATLAVLSDRVALAWAENVYADNSLRSMYAEVDTSGALLTAPSLLRPAAYSPRIVESDSGRYLFWFERTDDLPQLMFAPLELGGSLAAARVAPVPAASADFEAVAIDGHFAVTSRTFGDEDGRYRLVVFDADGEVRGDPVLLSTRYYATMFGHAPPALIRRGDELVVAWPEQEDASFGATIRIARFDGQAARAAPDVRLVAPVPGRENAEPRWLALGSDLGLIWSYGSVAPDICAGCTPDHSLAFVVLDGDDLTPKSTRLTLLNPVASGGLLGARAAQNGDDILVTASLTYHTWNEGVSAALRCMPIE